MFDEYKMAISLIVILTLFIGMSRISKLVPWMEQATELCTPYLQDSEEREILLGDYTGKE